MGARVRRWVADLERARYEGEVAEGLRCVAELALADRVVLLAEQADVVAQGQLPFEELDPSVSRPAWYRASTMASCGSFTPAYSCMGEEYNRNLPAVMYVASVAKASTSPDPTRRAALQLATVVERHPHRT